MIKLTKSNHCKSKIVCSSSSERSHSFGREAVIHKSLVSILCFKRKTEMLLAVFLLTNMAAFQTAMWDSVLQPKSPKKQASYF